MAQQYTQHLLMVRPAAFQFNTETAVSNVFQQELKSLSHQEIKQKAIQEFDNYVEQLRNVGVNVFVFQDSEHPPKPDAIFPNNWISMHADGSVYLYPMCTPNRRLERNDAVIEQLKTTFSIKEIKDWSHFENEHKFLEGTGSIIFDHLHKAAYASLSPRTDKQIFESYCAEIKYEPLVFTSSDKQDNLVYHTNVMLTIGDTFAVICSESIKDANERMSVLEQLTQSGHEIIDITFEQMNSFAGNMLQVGGKNTSFLVMSESACDSLTMAQREQIHKHTSILSVPIPTIETIGGGSARCMLAEIFLQLKN